MRTRTPAFLATVCAAVAGLALSAQQTATPQQVLRSSTNSVAVHVLVRNSRGPIRNLTTADFVITDSGVTQEIATMTTDDLPLDVTVVIEQLAQGEFAKREIHPQVADIQERLVPGDRLGVITVGTDVHEAVPMSAPGPPLPAPPKLKSDQSSFYDGVASALMRQTSPGRQHVIVAITEGFDAFSFTNGRALRDIAERSGALVYVIAAQGRFDKTRTLARAPQPPPDDGLGLLVELAKQGGGGEVTFSQLNRSITGSIARIFEDVRAGYVLYYTPAGVGERGWHPITVKVSRPDALEIRARPGYSN